MKVKSEKTVTWPEARHILETKEKIKALGYEQKKGLDHLNRFSKMNKKDLKELTGSLSEIKKLNEKHVVNIISFLPRNKDELNLLFASEHIILSEPDKDSILKLIKEFTVH
jgi:DNA-directed RNA polymerase subunit F